MIDRLNPTVRFGAPHVRSISTSSTKPAISILLLGIKNRA
jgi:hypothetical protein